jgi:putative flippase GtrA
VSGRHALPSRLGHFYREIAKFGVVGLAGVVVNLLAFNAIERYWGLQTVRASVLATFISIVCNYVGFRFFTYRDRDGGSRGRELALFFSFSLVGLVIENAVLYAATYGLGWDGRLQSNVFKFAGVGVATAFRFWSYRTWVFKVLDEFPAEEEATAPDAQPSWAPQPEDAEGTADWFRSAPSGPSWDRPDPWPASPADESPTPSSTTTRGGPHPSPLGLLQM